MKNTTQATTSRLNVTNIPPPANDGRAGMQRNHDFDAAPFFSRRSARLCPSQGAPGKSTGIAT
jgi:hypothetical protein